MSTSEMALSPVSSSRSSLHPAIDEVYSTFFQDDKFVTYPMRYKVSLSLSEKEIDLVRSSWKLMLTDSKASQRSVNQKKFSSATFASSLFCHQFYDNILDARPDLTEMFPSIRHQAVSFAGIMNITVNNLEDLSQLDSVLEHLGRTHSRILGIEGPFFELMGDSLIKTFQDRYTNMQIDFSIELEDCWIKLYCFLANSILQSGIDPIIQHDKPVQMPSMIPGDLTASPVSPQRLAMNQHMAQQQRAQPPQSEHAKHNSHHSVFWNKSRQPSETGSTTDQDTLFDQRTQRSSIVSSSRNSSISSAATATRTASTIDTTKKAFKSIAAQTAVTKTSRNKLSSKLRRGTKSDDDGTCVVM